MYQWDYVVLGEVHVQFWVTVLCMCSGPQAIFTFKISLKLAAF